MKNLAGDPSCDFQIRSELEQCNIDVVRVENHYEEVPYTLEGRLPGFTFRRAWRYWVVEGKMPLGVATDLWNSSLAVRQNVRAGGHGGCLHPTKECKWYDEQGRELIPQTEWDKLENICRECSDDSSLKPFWMGVKENMAIKEECAAPLGYVVTYHVDSELGLYLLADAIRSLKL